ncbi:Bug family tripartite tricarboxylate transporter substrate binding protein [Variovorax sp. VNK109]|uniref:Bug family tripartite tricarboxylate transporter substrate binding protein n=1 Tax=Variovorax sp. VNK109 TaxID=3400919 RepID=UPI003C03106F
MKSLSLMSRCGAFAGLTLTALAAVTAFGASSTAFAQEAYPSRPVRLIVPFAPGGATDVIGRLMAQKLGDALKGSVVVENKPGAGSVLGTDVGVKSPADGYTLVMTNGSAVTTAPFLRSSMPYKPIDDFTHIALIGTFPNAFVVRTENPMKTFAEFVQIAKAKPGTLNYSSAGVGSAGFLTGEMLKQMANAPMTHIAYKGTGPATVDLLGGQIDALFDGLPTAGAQARAGKVRVLAVTGAKRSPLFPDVPTMNEVVPGVIGEAWFGISMPAKTPQPVVDRLETEITRIITAPDVQARLIELGMTPMGVGRKEFGAFLRSETDRWGPVIKAANIQIE